MSDKYKSLKIDISSFIKLNKIDKNQKSNELYKKILKSRIPIDLLREMVYFYENNSEIFSYIHNNYKPNIGKICVILKAKITENNEAVKKFGKNLCMHIAASKPLALDIENLDFNLIKKEEEIQLATIQSSEKPQNIINKILEGKMKKFYSEVTLLNQSYILDPDKTIKEAILDFSSCNPFKIVDYELFVLGS